MSKKPRQSSSSQDERRGGGQGSVGEGDGKTAKHNDEETPATSGAPARERPALPAFGFADEVLTRKTADAAAPPLDAAAATGPERIYSFADSVSDAYLGEEEVAPKRLGTWVTFRLADETFAVPVEAVREVLRVSTVTRVPHAPEPIRGVTNLRGRVIPVIDLRLRIGLPAIDLDRSSRILVVDPRGRMLGLLVDAVRQVVHLDLDAIQAPPDDVMTVQSDYLTGVYQHDEGLLLLLDVDRALVINEAGAA